MDGPVMLCIAGRRKSTQGGPNRHIGTPQLKNALAFLLTSIFACKATFGQAWTQQPSQIQTRWASLVDPTNALPEYPRPQLVRGGWQTLNGLWDYAITQDASEPPQKYDGAILVPYPIESALSGVKRPLLPQQSLWYRRSFQLATLNDDHRLLLHFGAVDYRATVFLNGQKLGVHQGGYENFTFDITDAVKGGDNALVLRVQDPTDTGSNPHGKQVLHPRRTRYSATSGIWQTVWLEKVPQTYIDQLVIDPDVDKSQLHVRAILNAPSSEYSLRVTIKARNTAVVQEKTRGGEIQDQVTLNIHQPHLWSPDDPFLYDLQVTLLKEGRLIDEVNSYFGMRKIEVRPDEQGVDRIFLNNHYTYNLGVLDQGYWPEGLYTAPTDAALRFDIEAIKGMGFNTIRKHVKVEPDRWYYHCDRLGILVWQDMVSPADDSPEARQEFKDEVQATLGNLHNHPSIVTWVLFNEGWGAFDQENLGTWIKSLDPSRLVDAHSGARDRHQFEHWIEHLDPSDLVGYLRDEPDSKSFPEHNTQKDWVGGNLTDSHSYPKPVIPQSAPGMARALGEYGGIGVTVDGHIWNDLGAGWGYVQMTPDQLSSAYARMMHSLFLFEKEGLSASIYTQPFDVEAEQNGLMTYDRRVLKVPLRQLLTANRQIVPLSKNYGPTTRDFSARIITTASEKHRYGALEKSYRKGDRNMNLLRHLTLFALLQDDQATATAAGNDYLERVSRPYTADTWRFVSSVTRTPQDRGFSALQEHPEDANMVLGDSAAEKRVREVIRHEEIRESFFEPGAKPDWLSLENRVFDKYGNLGAEEIYGQEMLFYLRARDWTNFGKYCARYFDTALTRSEYPVSYFSHLLLTHVSDREVLDVAINASRYDIETGKEKTPTGYDSYANLLYKVGREKEAIDFEEKAVRLDAGHNPEIEDHLKKMRAGEPTWPTS